MSRLVAWYAGILGMYCGGVAVWSAVWQTYWLTGVNLAVLAFAQVLLYRQGRIVGRGEIIESAGRSRVGR